MDHLANRPAAGAVRGLKLGVVEAAHGLAEPRRRLREVAKRFGGRSIEGLEADGIA